MLRALFRRLRLFGLPGQQVVKFKSVLERRLVRKGLCQPFVGCQCFPVEAVRLVRGGSQDEIASVFALGKFSELSNPFQLALGDREEFPLCGDDANRWAFANDRAPTKCLTKS